MTEPKPPEFGSPDLGDATANFEQKVNEGAQKLIGFVRQEGPSILNRPPGTLPVKPEDKQFDFQQMHLDTNALAGLHAQMVSQVGEREATKGFLHWYRAGMKKMEK